MSLHGMDHDAWNRYGDKGSWYYEVKRVGYKFNMTDIQAALGLVQLQRAPELYECRRRAAERYLAQLAGEDALILPAVRADALHSWHLFVPRLREGALRIDRNRFLQALSAEGVSVSLHFIPIHHHPVHRDRFAGAGGRLPRSEAFYSGCFSLPLFPDIRDGEVDEVCQALRKLLAYYRR